MRTPFSCLSLSRVLVCACAERTCVHACVRVLLSLLSLSLSRVCACVHAGTQVRELLSHSPSHACVHVQLTRGCMCACVLSSLFSFSLSGVYNVRVRACVPLSLPLHNPSPIVEGGRSERGGVRGEG